MNIMAYFLQIKPNYKLFLHILFHSEILHMTKIKCRRCCFMLFQLCISPLGILVPFSFSVSLFSSVSQLFLFFHPFWLFVVGFILVMLIRESFQNKRLSGQRGILVIIITHYQINERNWCLVASCNYSSPGPLVPRCLHPPFEGRWAGSDLRLRGRAECHSAAGYNSEP